MLEELKLPHLIKRLEQSCEGFSDLRTGKNSTYDLPDVAMIAFSVFITESPSLLAHQRDMKLRKGRSNAESLFEQKHLPSDNQIRNLLDPVEPHHLQSVYRETFLALEKTEVPKKRRSFANQILVAIDGTEFFSS